MHDGEGAKKEREERLIGECARRHGWDMVVNGMMQQWQSKKEPKKEQREVS